ncbi:hypothetical protein Q5752_006828 [Cryptotrichosporon argae]
MGKRAEQTKKRKRGGAGSAGAAGGAAPVKPIAAAPRAGDVAPPVNGAASGSDLLSLLEPEELETAVFVLDTLAANPRILVDKRLKELKRATHGLYRVLAEGAGIGASLTSRISAALQDYRFTDALVLLFEMHARGVPPKLGALQRWVRECDATSNADGSPGDAEAFRCLDLILRIANRGVEEAGAAHGPGSRDDGKDNYVQNGMEIAHVRNLGTWSARGPVDGEIPVWAKMQAGALAAAGTGKYPNFRAVHHVPAALRRPPNKYDSTVYASAPGAIRLTDAAARRPASRVDVPGVPGAFVVLDVFTPDECLQIVQAASAIGFEKDEAAEGSAKQKTSILARNFVWLADNELLDHFHGQILPFVPPHAATSADGNGGGSVRGINARFRVYQYTENQLYRPHIDGAWPAAGLDPATGDYLHDSSPPSDPLWSRYTLLVYLNSDIPHDTGGTTFFLPSREMGVMDARSVRPIQGAVLCFPHGDTQGSLLHEGSAVGQGGGKLVIRTDLLYEAKGYGQFKPAAPTDETT